MAIKIVKLEPDQSVVKRCICRKCGVTLEYTPSDVVYDSRTDYTGGSDPYNTISCPNCPHRIVV